jgi:hypothetical protein
LTRANSLIGVLVLLVAAVMLCFDGTRDGDLYLQMVGGRQIAQHGLTSIDPFLTIAHGTTWLNQQWLTELTVYSTAQAIGVTGMTIAYAGLLAAPLALLLWLCRRKGPTMMIALVGLYCPGLWVIVHPRAAGFTLLAFSIVIGIVGLTWFAPRSAAADRRLRFGVAAILAVFALWANLHGGFVAGLLLLGVAALGLGLDRLRGFSEAIGGHRLGVLAITGALALATTSLATPLGSEIWSYLLSFRNPAIAFVSGEWRSTLQAPLAMLYVALAAGFASWLWLRLPSPRPIAPLLVSLSFLAFAVLALRNLIFVGPVLALQVARSTPDREGSVPRSLIALAAAATVGVIGVWLTSVGPARNEHPLGSRLVAYAYEHPPRVGHIASYAGVGSYMLWRSPRTPVLLDGWLEHFTPTQLRGTYALLDGRKADPGRLASRLHIGAVIASRHVAIVKLLQHGFVVRFATRDGAYLVRHRPHRLPSVDGHDRRLRQ